MTAKDDREKDRGRRDAEGKFFFGLSTATYTVVVLGGLATLFGIADTRLDTFFFIAVGIVLMTVFAIIGHKILKK